MEKCHCAQISIWAGKNCWKYSKNLSFLRNIHWQLSVYWRTFTVQNRMHLVQWNYGWFGSVYIYTSVRSGSGVSKEHLGSIWSLRYFVCSLFVVLVQCTYCSEYLALAACNRSWEFSVSATVCPALGWYAAVGKVCVTCAQRSKWRRI